MEDLFVPTAAVRPVLQAAAAMAPGSEGAEYLTAQQCTDIVQAYVKNMARARSPRLAFSV